MAEGNPSFKEWFEENKHGGLAEDFEEYKENCKLEGIPAGRYIDYARERYKFLFSF
jgi:hypothetical protein